MIQWPEHVESFGRTYIGAVDLRHGGEMQTYLLFDASSMKRDIIVAVQPGEDMPEGMRWASADVATYIRSKEPEPIYPYDRFGIVESLSRSEQYPQSLDAVLRFCMAMKATSAGRMLAAKNA